MLVAEFQAGFWLVGDGPSARMVEICGAVAGENVDVVE